MLVLQNAVKRIREVNLILCQPQTASFPSMAVSSWSFLCDAVYPHAAICQGRQGGCGFRGRQQQKEERRVPPRAVEVDDSLPASWHLQQLNSNSEASGPISGEPAGVRSLISGQAAYLCTSPWPSAARWRASRDTCMSRLSFSRARAHCQNASCDDPSPERACGPATTHRRRGKNTPFASLPRLGPHATAPSSC